MIRPFGEAALLVELGELWRVHAMEASLRAQPIAGVVEAVPGVETLLVEVEPLGSNVGGLLAELEQRVAGLVLRPSSGRHRSIPCRYGGDAGPDLEEVARLCGLAPDEVVRRHAAVELVVEIVGFAPGFPYLGELPAELDVPRLSTPRTSTPAGSVAIAGRRSGIYPATLPGGWRVIGRTPLTLFDALRDPPTYLAPGDRVRFEPIDAEAWDAHAGPAADW